MSSYPPATITATAPCPACGGALKVARDKTQHRRRLCCADCAYSERLPETLRLRMAGHPELPLFNEAEDEQSH